MNRRAIRVAMRFVIYAMVATVATVASIVISVLSVNFERTVVYHAPHTIPTMGEWLLWINQGPGGMRVDANWVHDESTRHDIEYHELELPEGGRNLPRAIRRELLAERRVPRTQRIFEVRGWPWAAAWCEFRRSFGVPVQDRVTGGVSLDHEDEQHRARSGRPSLPRAIPMRPLWFGLLGDLLFFGIGAYLAVVGARASRVLVRRARGRCPKCAYDLRGELDAGCSECGWNRPEAEKARLPRSTDGGKDGTM